MQRPVDISRLERFT
jgi:tubulin polyglutamylase TTLL4